MCADISLRDPSLTESQYLGLCKILYFVKVKVHHQLAMAYYINTGHQHPKIKTIQNITYQNHYSVCSFLIPYTAFLMGHFNPKICFSVGTSSKIYSIHVFSQTLGKTANHLEEVLKYLDAVFLCPKYSC